MKITANTQLLKSFLYNLELFSPNKGEAKKTNGRGDVYLRSISKLDGQYLFGLATDDHYSLSGYIPLDVGVNATIFSSAEELKTLRGGLDSSEFSTIEFTGRAADDDSFAEVFWEGHVTDCVQGDASRVALNSFSLNPERLRKLSLLEPRGYPLHQDFVEWADRTIIRFTYTENFRGVVNLVGINGH